MACGLFGKLPAKRDFVAVNVPHAVLHRWEAWLQGGVSASRAILGDRWQDIFLTAPIWRFWLGEEICGKAVLGCVMPSVDGVGRYFPLSVLALAAEDRVIPAPTVHRQESWFVAAENLLLEALDQDRSYQETLGGLAALNEPADIVAAPKNIARVNGALVTPFGGEDDEDSFIALRDDFYARAVANTTFWWTIGGDEFPARIVASTGLPDPHLFSAMLTGRFEGA